MPQVVFGGITSREGGGSDVFALLSDHRALFYFFPQGFRTSEVTLSTPTTRCASSAVSNTNS